MEHHRILATAGCVHLRRIAVFFAAGALLCAAGASSAIAQKQYAPGITDTEIKIGQTVPYSGPASAYSTFGKAETAYYRMINDAGGINGRKIRLISLDDGYSPPKTFEQTRRLIEQDGVALIVGSLGTATNTAIQKYLNDRKIPQLFISTLASKFNDPRHFPWTMPSLAASYHTEGMIYAKYILRHSPNARIAVLYQNDDYGKDYVQGLKDGLGPQAAQRIVATASYEVTDATADSQVVSLQASGADTLYDVSTPKFAAQIIRKTYDIGWKPTHFLNAVAAYVGLVFQPAGIEKARGIISASIVKDITDPRLAEDAEYKEWLAWMRSYYPEGNVLDAANVNAYLVAQSFVQVLQQCGDDLSRDNIMRQAANIDLRLKMLLPGLAANTSPTDYEAVKQMYVRQFNGKTWDVLETLVAEN
ncbi:MAG TPA: ABC transporter substrate-binding protein [Stellaceae bacterium]|jgi:branched-chain amino acid transport system substrate-binding protein|nr:ABC transporter substrate-binding protein [Stellaceae bacterium]